MKRELILSGILLGMGVALFKGFNFWNPEDIVDTLPKHSYKTFPKRSLDDITHIVVHHSATPSTAGGSNPQGYATFHTWEAGPYNMAGIAYHVVIQPDGKAYLTNYLDTTSYHVGTLNPKAVGVVISGNFDVEQPNQKQLATLEKTLRWIQQKVGKKLIIHPHSKYSSKTCAGANMNQYIPSLRQAVGGKV